MASMSGCASISSVGGGLGPRVVRLVLPFGEDLRGFQAALKRIAERWNSILSKEGQPTFDVRVTYRRAGSTVASLLHGGWIGKEEAALFS